MNDPPDLKGALLIVDDIEDNITLMLRFLTRAGYTVLTASDGEHALQLARQANPDVILLDIMMPGMDGYEVCERLKAAEETRDIPVIFMTALTDMQDKLRGFKAGAADYLAKPVERAEVLARVTVHVKLRRLQQELLEKNRQLEEEVKVRKETEAAIQRYANLLTERNEEMEKEIEERRQTQEKLNQANEKLQRLANLDGLTGIANRRRLDEYLDQEWRRLGREKQPLAVIFCDIDHFKAYNDNYDHLRGDDCLREVATLLGRSARRPADLAARYGGEEFVLILPNTSLDGALAVARQVQHDLATMRLPHAYSPIAPYITLSMGVACVVPQNGGSAEQFLRKADRALRKAKDTGRNRVVVAEEEPGDNLES
jgi:diguanylate cyclase (GGDEF)-like protein